MVLVVSPPHGGALVDLRVEDGRAAELAEAARRLPVWELSRRQRCDLELLATGGFSPLRTFLDQADHESVCAAMRLSTGELWPVPVTLDLPEQVVATASAAGGVLLRARGVDAAVLWLETAWRPDRRAEAAAVLGTTDPAHPGVQALLRESHPWYVSGPLEVLRLPPHHGFRSIRHTPGQLRVLMAGYGWDRVVAFQTRNPMHRAHQELTVRAAGDLDANLLLHPVVGVTKPGDVDPHIRVRCYRALLPTYPPGRVLLSVLPLAMRMAGPREALWHAIVRKNHGATHFIVGRDHAGPGEDSAGRPFYEPYAAQELLGMHAGELGIGVVPFRQMVYVEELQGYVPEDDVQPGQHCLRISGTEQRRRLARGEELPAWFTPPEVAAELRRAFPPRSERGVCVLLPDALPGPWGDQAAAAVAAGLREAGRTVTLLSRSLLAGGEATSHLVVHLIGEVMRNGGAVLCPAGAVHGLDHAAARLAEQGLVVDVGIAGEEPGLADAPPTTGSSCTRLLVPVGGGPELVGDVVVDHVRTSGYLEPAVPAALRATRDGTPGAPLDDG